MERNEIISLIDNLSDGLIAVNKNKITTTINKSALRMLGVENIDNFLGKNIEELITVIINGKKNYPLDKVLSDNMVFSENNVQIFFNQYSATVNLNINPMLSSSKNVTGAIFFFRDITEEKAIDEQRAEFNAIASHELRTPITIIGGYASNIRTDKTLRYDKRTAENIDAILEAVDRLNNITNDVLTVTRADNNMVKLYLEEGDFNLIVLQSLEELRHIIKEKRLPIKKDFGDLPISYMDPQKVRQVMTNLISNAVKFSDNGQIIIETSSDKNNFKFSVTDKGVGIAKKDQAKIFEKFYRTEDWHTRKTGGTGLGLYISKTLTEIMGGNIGFKSAPQKGSTFWFTVPITKSLQKQKKEKQEKLDDFITGI